MTDGEASERRAGSLAADGTGSDVDSRSTAGSTVLVVDDDPNWLALARERLEDDYEVLTAAMGEEALGLHGEADIVLLDRRLPGISGEETLERIRDAGCSDPVVLVTNVEPEVEIADWPFDDYVLKSENDTALAGVVENVLDRASFGELVQERFALASKKAALQARHDRSTLEANAEYRRLVDRLEDLRRGITPRISELNGEQAFSEALRGDDSSPRTSSSR